MNNTCPNCDSPPLGGQIVELRHGTTNRMSYGIICPNCSLVYHSRKAEEQMGELFD